jgi:hypothetical protein
LPDDDLGLDTAVVEDVDGLLMPPASFITWSYLDSS